MNEFKINRFEVINNQTFAFFKLKINGKSYFDQFEAKLTPDEKSELRSIYAFMDKFSENLYPKTIFNSIKGKKVKKNEQRSDLYEFKSKHLRIYVVWQKPNVFIVMGGSKNTQDNDTVVLHKRLKGFPNSLDVNNPEYFELEEEDSSEEQEKVENEDSEANKVEQ